MKKMVKIIGAAGAVALAAALVPYHFKSDKESGEFELGGLLWNLKKTSGEEEDTYTMELLPFMDKELENEPVEADVEVETPEEAPQEEEPEEPFAEEVSNDVIVEEVDTAAQAAAEAAQAPQEDPQEEEEAPAQEEEAQEEDEPSAHDAQ